MRQGLQSEPHTGMVRLETLPITLHPSHTIGEEGDNGITRRGSGGRQRAEKESDGQETHDNRIMQH